MAIVGAVKALLPSKSHGKSASLAPPSLFNVNLTLVRATGFWRRPDPRQAGSRWWGLVRRAQGFYFRFNVACNVAFLSSKLVHTALDTSSIRSITENLSDVLCIAFSLLQLLVLVEHEDRLVHLMHAIDRQFRQGLQGLQGPRGRGLAEQKEQGRRMTVSTFCSFLGTAFIFAVIVTTTGNREHALPVPIWTPFPQDDPGTLGILLLVEATGVVLTVAGSGALSALFLNSFLAVESQFKGLHDFFRSEGEGLPDGAWSGAKRRQVQQRLTEGVKLHQDLLKVADELCSVLAPFLTVQLGTIVFMICIALFQISMNPSDPGNIRFFALASTVTIESYVLCWMGTRMSDEAMKVQLGLETGDWYLQGNDIASIIKFAIMRSQKPPCVVVGNNVSVGLPVFLEMIRSSYSLLAFLQKRARNESS